jgi:3-oxoacyl-[acyl-carrier protein] reductase
MTSEPSGRVALITGASRGIGKGIALDLARAGCDVMLTARNAESLAEVAEEVKALGRKVAIHASDLTLPEAPAALTSPMRTGARVST